MPKPCLICERPLTDYDSFSVQFGGEAYGLLDRFLPGMHVEITLLSGEQFNATIQELERDDDGLLVFVFADHDSQPASDVHSIFVY